MKTDFLIVGGGIAGGVLAELLGRAGKTVLLLEKTFAPPNWVRPEILWPATAEVLFSLLPRQTWEEKALLCLGGIEVRDGSGTIRSISTKVFQKIQVERWAADANETRELLLSLSSFELRRGIEVIGVLKEENRVIGVRMREVASGREAEILAAWTIGDDGAYSLVRQACGLEMETRLFPIDFLCFGFSWPAVFEKTTTKIWLNLEKADGILALLAVPLPQGRGAGVILVRPEVLERKEWREETLKRFYGSDSLLTEVVAERTFPSDFTRVRRYWGHAARYGMRGAILMGDAAHPVSPAGGQGANMSVADARVLAQVALGNSSRLLEEYECCRRKANARSLRFTRLAAWALNLPTLVLPTSFLLSVAHRVTQHPSLFRPFVRYVSTAFQEK